MSTSFAALQRQFDPIQKIRIPRKIADVVLASFEEDGSRKTHDEIRRRTDLCCDLVAQLMGDLRWPEVRVFDTLSRALRAKLDGKPWEPSARTSWVVEEEGALTLDAPLSGLGGDA